MRIGKIASAPLLLNVRSEAAQASHSTENKSGKYLDANEAKNLCDEVDYR